MIARTWRGATAAEDAEDYVRYLETTGFQEYRMSPGNLGVVCLHRTDGDRTDFLIVSLWDSEEAAIGFAGGDPSRAVFYPEDDRFLIERDDFVRHHDVGYHHFPRHDRSRGSHTGAAMHWTKEPDLTNYFVTRNLPPSPQLPRSSMEELSRPKGGRTMGANTPVAMHPRPSLGYRDAPAAVRFLQEAFGFELLAIYDGPRDGTVAHAELRWPSGGSITLHTAASAENSVGGVSAWIAEQEGYPAFGIHLDTDDPDTAYERARAAGATIIRPLSDSPHGTRGFIARDPEGLFWSVGTPPPRGEAPQEGP